MRQKSRINRPDPHRVGNRTTKTDNNGTATYTYDSLNRLVNAANPIPTNSTESYTYDPIGNRTDSNQNGLSNFNAGNQLTDDTEFSYFYDNNGNLTQKTNQSTSAFTLYQYDAENKLIRVVREDGSIVNYKYDGLGRRIEKEVDMVVTRYIYDNEDVLLELDGSNNIVARYTHGPGVDEPLIMEKSSQSFFYHADGLGSITEVTDTAGMVVQVHNYSSFGKIESQLDPNFVQPYTYTAREFDPETNQYFYRSRNYNDSTGRFFQEDLILGAKNVVARNPRFLHAYAYVGNNPVNRIDPFGFFEVPPELKGEILIKVLEMVIAKGIGGITGAACASRFCKRQVGNVDWWAALSECMSVFARHDIPTGFAGSANLVTACADECSRITKTGRFNKACCSK